MRYDKNCFMYSKFSIYDATSGEEILVQDDSEDQSRIFLRAAMDSGPEIGESILSIPKQMLPALRHALEQIETASKYPTKED